MGLALLAPAAAWAGLAASVTLVSGQSGTIYPAEVTQLQINLSNNSTGAPISTVAFSTTLPGTLPNGLKIAGAVSYTCTDPAGPSTAAGVGTLSAVPGSQLLQLSGGVIPAKANNTDGLCTITVPVTAGSSSGSAATYTYSIANGAVTGNDGAPVANVGNVSQSIVIRSMVLPSLSKLFNDSMLILGGSARTLSIQVSNSNAVPIPNFALADIFPTLGGGGAIMRVASTPAATASCTGGGTPPVFSPAAGDTSLSASGGTVAANGSCTLSVAVEGVHTNGAFSTGTQTNTILGSSFTNGIGLVPANATASVTVQSPLTLTKTSAFSFFASGTTGSFTVTLSNASSAPLSITSFDDSPIDGVAGTGYGLVATGGSTSCAGGSVSVINGGDGVRLSGGTIPANGSCTLSIDFTAQVQTPGATESYTNTVAAGAVGLATPGIVSQSASRSVSVADALRIRKDVNELGVVNYTSLGGYAPGNPAWFNVTINNFAASALSNVAITERFTQGMTLLNGVINGLDFTPQLVASTPGACSGLTVSGSTGASTPVFTIGTLAPRLDASNASVCLLQFYALVPTSASNNSIMRNVIAAGDACYDPGTGLVCNATPSNSVTADVTTGVVGLSKSYNLSSPRPEGTVLRARFELRSLSANPLSNVTLSDNLPAAASGGGQMVVANPANAVTDCGAPTINATPGSTSISMSGATVPARANNGRANSVGVCNLYVDVVAGAGTYTNTASFSGTARIADGSGTYAVGPTTGAASAFTFSSAFTASKSFSPAAVSSGGRSTVRVRLSNSSGTAFNNAAFTDPLPAGMVLASPTNAYTTCAGSPLITASAGASSLAVAGLSVAAGGSCEVLFDVLASGAGNWTNTLAAGAITAEGGIRNQTPVSATLSNLGGGSLLVTKATNPGTLTFPGQVSQLTISLNNGGQALSDLRLTDYFTTDGRAGAPANGMIIAPTPNLASTCPGGTVSATSGGSSVSLSGATLGVGGSCTVSVNVTSTSVGGITNIIPAGAVQSSEGVSNPGQATTSLATGTNIGLAKQFLPNVVKPGVSSRLRITIYNASSSAASALAFADTLPAGLSFATPANASTSCTGGVATASGGQLSLSGGSLAAAVGGTAAACLVEADVVSASAGDYLNTIPALALTGSAGGVPVSNAESASDTLRVKLPLVLQKLIDGLGTASTLPGLPKPLTIRVDNPNSTPVTAVAFTDVLPSGLVVGLSPNASTSCTGAVLQAAPSATSIRLSGATVPANGSCTVSVDVLSNLAATYTNTIPAAAVSSFEGVSNEQPTSAQLIVAAPPTLSKQFAPTTIGAGSTSVLTITLGNSNATAMTLSSALVDSLPIGGSGGQLRVASVPGVSKTCPGSVTAAANATTISYASGSTIPPGGCSISVNVSAAAGGIYTNVLGSAALATNFGSNAQPASAVLQVDLPQLRLSKSGPTTIAAGGTAVFSVTISNIGTLASSGLLSLTDTLPAGLSFVAKTAGPASMSCSAAGQIVSCTDTSSAIPASGGSVTLSYSVTAASPLSGPLVNQVRVKSGEGGGDPRTPSCASNLDPLSNGSGSNSSDGLCAKWRSGALNGTLLVSKALLQINSGGGFVNPPAGYAAKNGDQLRYRITVTETGGAAASVLLTETVPAHTSYSGSGEGWSAGCAAAASSCSQTVAVSASGTATRDYTVTVGALADNVTTLVNTVGVSGANCLSCIVSTPTVPRLNLLKTGGGSIGAGGRGSYTLTLSNVGGSATSGVVTLSDTLPSGLSFASQLSGALSCSGTTSITCTGTPNLAAGGSLALIYEVSASGGASGTLTNAVQVTAGGGDTRSASCDNAAAPAAGAGNQSSDKLCAKWSEAVVSGTPQTSKLLSSVVRGGVTLTGASLPASVQAGDRLIYTLKVQNTAAGATSTVLTETVPAHTSYSGSGEGWSVSGASYTQTVAVGANATVDRTFTVTVATPIPDNVVAIANTVATSAGVCTSCSVSTPTVPKLRLSKSGPASIPAGGVGGYILTLSNVGGSSTSGDLDFSDYLPAGQTFATSNPTTVGSLTCSSSAPFTLGRCVGTLNLQPGQSVSVSYNARVADAASGVQTNRVEPTSVPALKLAGDPRSPVCDNADPAAGADSVSGDGLCAKWSSAVTLGSLNTSKVLALVNGAAVPAGYQAKPGDVLSYQINVSASTAAGSTTVTETVPAHTRYSGSGEGWSTGCAAAGSSCGQSVTVSAGATLSKSFTVTVDASLPSTVSTLINTLTSSNGSCSACSVATAVEPAKLSLAKSGPASFTAGGSGSFDIVIRNEGGRPSSGLLTLIDTLPAGLSFVAKTAGPASMSCTAAGQTLSCTDTSSAIPAGGGSVTLSYSVAAGPLLNEPLVNQVRVKAGEAGGDTRTPDCSSHADPLSNGSGSASSDGLCAKWRTGVFNATRTVSKALFQVNTGSGFVTPSAGYAVTSGDQLKYRITVTERGRAAAEVLLTETVPAHTRYSGSGEGWSAGCAAAGSNCTQAVSVTAGGTATRDYTVTVGTVPDNVTTLVNTVAVGGGGCLSCTVSTATSPRLNLLKTGGADIGAGGRASFTLSLSNVGGSATSGVVTLGDSLPSGLSFANQLSGALTCSGGTTITCTGTPNLAPGARLSLSYEVNVSAAASGTLTNSVQVTAGGGDPRSASCDNAAAPAAGAGNQSSDKLCAKWSSAVGQGLLSTSKSLVLVNGAAVPAGYQAKPGDVLSYQIDVSASGAAGSSNLTETVPAHTRYSGSAEGWSADCGAAGSSCTQNVTVSAGATLSKRFTVTVDAVLAAGAKTISNTVSSSNGSCSPCTVNTRVRDNTPAAVSGYVWLDANRDRRRGSEEAAAPGVLVTLRGLDGQTVPGQPDRLSDANGFYKFIGVPPGNYRIGFGTATGVVYGTPTYNDQTAATVAGTLYSNAAGSTSEISALRDRLSVNLAPGDHLQGQSLPLDPSGVVYDDSLRRALGGVAVTLEGPPGFEAERHLVGGAANRVQLTPADGPVPGLYQFLLQAGAPAGRYCLSYGLAEYSPSERILPAGESFTPPANPGVAISINRDNLNGVPPPQTGQDTRFYRCFELTPGQSSDVVNNHLPLMRNSDATLVLTKQADKRQAVIGDLVRYQLGVRLGAGTVANRIQLRDALPRGFALVAGTAQVSKRSGTGASAAPLALGAPVAVASGRSADAGWLEWAIPAALLPLRQGEQLSINYRVRIGVGALQGDGVNRAQAFSDQQPSNEARWEIKLGGGVFEPRACVVGKVFVDCNANHVQDEQELGIPGVRLYLEDGTHITSDVDGKYSFCGLRPITHVIKVDASSLPSGARLKTTSNRNAGDGSSQFLDAKFGELLRADFVEGSCHGGVVAEVLRRRQTLQLQAPGSPASAPAVPPALRFESSGQPRAPHEGMRP